MLKDNTKELQQILAKVNALPEAGGEIPEPVLQEKTVTPTKNEQTVTPDEDYDGLSKVTINPIPSEYIIPEGEEEITVNGTYDISEYESVKVNVPVPSGYVKPTATKGATTYTPTTSNQTIASGTYLSGTQTIKGDANLKAENIKSGVSIFGVNGSYEGTGGGSGSIETCTVVYNFSYFNFNNYEHVIYINGDGEAVMEPLKDNTQHTFTVQKNTLFYSSCGTGVVNGNATPIADPNGDYFLALITDDVEFD